MHFRHLLITSLLIGSAMFLPDDVLAEKNDLNGKQNFQKESVQVDPSVEVNIGVVKPDNSVTQKPVMRPEPPSKNHEVEKQQQPTNLSGSQNTSVLKKLPEQAKEQVKSALEKGKKPDKTPLPAKKTAVQENKNGLEKNKPAFKNKPGKDATLDSLQLSEAEVMIQDQSVKSEPQGNATTSQSVGMKEDSSESIVQNPEKNGEKPLDNQELPKASQGQNPTQRTSSNGAPSNDRTNYGFNTISFLDKWFALNPYYEIQLIQTYQSRYIWLNNQWVNAPPSPPPQEALFLETVTRS